MIHDDRKSHTGIDTRTLYEQLNRLIDKPHEYNRVISQLLTDLVRNLHGILWEEGVVYADDPDRQRIISIYRATLTAGFYGNNVTDRYLRMDGVTMAGGQGYPVARKGIITGLWAKSRSSGQWFAEIRRNNLPITLVSIPVVNGYGKEDFLDVEIEEGDTLELYASGSGIEHPIVGMEIAWRLDNVGEAEP